MGTVRNPPGTPTQPSGKLNWLELLLRSPIVLGSITVDNKLQSPLISGPSVLPRVSQVSSFFPCQPPRGTRGVPPQIPRSSPPVVLGLFLVGPTVSFHPRLALLRADHLCPPLLAGGPACPLRRTSFRALFDSSNPGSSTGSPVSPHKETAFFPPI